MPNHPLLTQPSRFGCKRSPLWGGSLSLGLGDFCLSGCFSRPQAEAIAWSADHKSLRVAETCG